MKRIFNNLINNDNAIIFNKHTLNNGNQRTISRFMQGLETLRHQTKGEPLSFKGGKYKSCIRNYTQLLSEVWLVY